MATQRERDAMRLAIAASAHGIATTSPNPPVGCVVLDRDGEVVGVGYHQRKGEPHAEVHALLAAGSRAGGGTAVVTLEPCNHVGRTPACRQALLDARVARVVIALIDPTSRDGGGAVALRSAGISVEVGVLADEARTVLGPWLKALDLGRPMVTAGYSLGSRDDVSVLVEELRGGVDALLYADGRVEEGVPASHGQGVLELPQFLSTEDPAAALSALYAGGVRSVLLVGEPDFIDGYVRARLVDRIVVIWRTLLEPSSSGHPSVRPTGYRIASLTKTAGHVRIEFLPE